MRHDDSIYLSWLRAESRCRAASHELYMLVNSGGRPPDRLLDEFSRSIQRAHDASVRYLGHLQELVRHSANSSEAG